MSTRATYQFDDKHKARATLYIHHDGYPMGAAYYFYRTLCFPHRRGCMATRMIRAIDGAELTGEHAAHGDTEYRYNVCGCDPGATIEALARKGGWGVNEPEKWAPVPGAPSTLAEFIDQYIDPTWLEAAPAYSVFRLAKTEYGKRWYNLETAMQYINGNTSSGLPTLRHWAAKGRMTNLDGTWRAVADRVKALAEAFELTAIVEEVDALTASITPTEKAVTR